MTSAVLGSLTTLKVQSGSPFVFATVAEVLRIGQVGSSAPEVDVTNLDSTAKEYIGGLPDGASMEFEFNWIRSTNQQFLRDSVGDTVSLQLTWPDSPASTAAFSFVVLGFNMNETTPESQLTASVSGRITGAITWG